MKFRNRQIHLDFHTSGLIDEVAAQFDSQVFIDTLKKAHVGGICLFARCHHGYCYYPTQTGTVHPHLKEPRLLEKQLEAVRAADMQVGIYTTICWDELSADRHPEWLCLTADNEVMKMDPLTGELRGRFEAGWRFLCWNSPYRQWFKTHLEELLGLYRADYLFLDILFTPTPCVCGHCVARMRCCGLDPEIEADRERNSIDSAREFMDEVSTLIRRRDPEIGIFYNSRLRITGETDKGSIPELKYQNGIIIESLPSGPWGYDHFPIMARYLQNFDQSFLGDTGKFQKMWGDFGGLKNPAALDYEVMRMLSLGVAACVGDQMHPRGILDPATYELIGSTFEKVKPLESVLLPSRPVDEIAVMLTNRPRTAKNFGAHLDPETGAMKLLTQLQYQFSFVDPDSDLSGFKLLILPDEVILTAELRKKIEAYLAAGGRVLASYNSIFDDSGAVALGRSAILRAEELEYVPHYFHPSTPEMQNAIADTDHVFYLRAKRITPTENTTAFCRITLPYFNRRWDHFCSHLQTPPDRRTDIPEVLSAGDRLIYIAGEIFTCYHRYSPRVLKQVVDFSLRRLLEERLIESDLPSTAEVTLRRNGADQYVLTILSYIPQRRSENLDIVEEPVPLFNKRVSVLCEQEYKKVYDHVAEKPVTARRAGRRLELELPVINGFTVLTLER